MQEILNKYKNSKYQFFNEPKKIELEDYQKAADEAILKFSKMKDVCSVYSLTGPGALGISDLDLFVILKNDFENSSGEDFKKENFSEIVQYALDHIIQRKDLFSKLYWRYYYRWAVKENTIKCIWGEDVEPEKISQEDIYINKLYYLAGILLTKMPRDLVRSIARKRISIRGLLQVIYTLKFTIILESQITGIPSKEKWIKFANNFEEFRKKWFELGKEKYQILIDSLFEATEISFEIVEEFSNFIQEKGLIKSPKVRNDKKFTGIFSGYNFYTIFYNSREISLTEALRLSLNLNKSKIIKVLFLPSEFSTYLWQLSKASKGVRSDYIAKNLVFFGEEPEILAPEEINHREKLFNSYMDFMRKSSALATSPGGAQEMFGLYAGDRFKDKIIRIFRDFRSQIIKIIMINYAKR